MQALAELRARVVRKAVLVRVADVPLARYFAEPDRGGPDRAPSS